MKNSNDSQDLFSNASVVFGYIAIKDLRTIDEKVNVLSRLGYGNKEIAVICDSTESFVAKTKSLQKKNKRR